MKTVTQRFRYSFQAIDPVCGVTDFPSLDEASVSCGFKTSHVSPKDPVTDERIGGDKMWYTNLEITFPLFEEAGLRGVVFTDFGNVYAVEDDWNFDEVKKAAGVGFRWLSPMGPLRLEWGYNLDPEPDEDSSVWDFSIGGGF